MATASIKDLSLPGLHLIEASAGTGKTTALTLLFLRAILEGHEIEQILVVTFTEAATEEVRGRIHDLLAAARRRALGEPIAGKFAPFLDDIFPHHVSLLTRALFDFDRSTMTTIHAFCRRLLREYAFEFRAPFSLSLEEDASRSKSSAFREIWRRRVYPDLPDIARLIAAAFPEGPAEFRALVPDAALFRESERILVREPQDPDDFPVLKAEWLLTLSRCRRIETSRIDELAGVFEEREKDQERGKRKKSTEGDNGAAGRAGALLRRLREIVSAAPAPLPGWDFQDDRLREALDEVSLPFSSDFEPVRSLLSTKETLEKSLRQSIKRDLLAYLRTEALAERERRGVETFDDMILRVLEGVLSDPDDGLTQKIRKRFPVAFVDEFQDTDLAQLRIFDKIYRLSEGLPEEAGHRPALFLVGDPKQSIYRFRGADITAYLEARQRAVAADGDALLTLSVNYRSDRKNVEAINRLFLLVPDPFRTGRSISYTPVTASHEDPSRFRDRDTGGDGDPVPVLFYTGEPGEKSEDFALKCAREIHRLISGMATIGGRSVRPDEIAVLVRQHSHGKQVQEALDDMGIPSVSYGSESVLETEEAFDLEMLLLSIASPDDRRQHRLVLTSRLFGLCARDLVSLEESQELWNRKVDPFFRAARQWSRLGAMGTLRALFLEQGVFSRLLAMRGGRRRVAHLLHLFELLEEMGRDRPPLLLHVDRYLSARREAPGKKEDRNAPRLESFDGRVRILTFHKAKGLEFPIVILPFGIPYRADPLEEEDGHGKDSEEMRLLYVALTRSVHRTVVMIASQTLKQSALAHLLGITLSGHYGKKHREAFQAKIQELIAEDPHLFALLPQQEPTEAVPVLSNSEPAPRILPGREAPFIPAPKRTESFSSLLRRSLAEGAAEFFPSGVRAEDEGPEKEILDRSLEDPVPAGPLFGSYFHRIMERLALPGLLPEDLAAPLSSKVFEESLADLELSGSREFSHWPSSVRPLVERTLSADLGVRDGDGSPPLTLAHIFRGDRAVEREFLLPIRRVGADALSTFLEPEGPRLAFDPVTGSLKGFIDLLFRDRDRYFLLDYKTNRLFAPLGEDPYGPKHLRLSMAEHRYDLQGLIYILAMHRLLSFSLPGYDYERDFGGAIFLFVRGVGTPGRGIVRCRPSVESLQTFDRLLAGEAP